MYKARLDTEQQEAFPIPTFRENASLVPVDLGRKQEGTANFGWLLVHRIN